MGSWVHRLSSINYDEKTAICSSCGPVVIRSMGYAATSGRRQWRCKPALDLKKRLRFRPWTAFKKDSCERCGFIPEHTSQLDVDHIDGNNQNNDPKNLQTLCANCHRLKTVHNQDWKNKVSRVQETQVY